MIGEELPSCKSSPKSSCIRRYLLEEPADKSRVLQYPNVPNTLSDTLGNMVALSTFKVLGNHTVPSTSPPLLHHQFISRFSIANHRRSGGRIPERLLRLASLAELDLEFTALTGPLPDTLDGLPRLRSLTLVNNQQLGTNIPSLSENRDLSTL